MMYDYRIAIKADVSEAINDRFDEIKNRDDIQDADDLREFLQDELWADDSVTGNASGSYTFSRATARDYVMGADFYGNDNTELVLGMAESFGIDAKTIGEHFLADDWEWFDVSIRCYLLGECIDAVIEEDDILMEYGEEA